MYDWLLDAAFNTPEWEGEREVAVVSHGHALRSLLQRVMSFDPSLVWRVRIDNTSLTTIRHDDWGWGVEQLNARPHLPGWHRKAPLPEPSF